MTEPGPLNPATRRRKPHHRPCPRCGRVIPFNKSGEPRAHRVDESTRSARCAEPDGRTQQVRILKAVIPVDDQMHAVEIEGKVRHAEATGPDEVSIWFASTGPANHRGRSFVVLATGESAGYGLEYAATCRHADSGLVWHLFEVTSA